MHTTWRQLTLNSLLMNEGMVWAIDVEERPPAAKHEVNFVKEILPIFKNTA